MVYLLKKDAFNSVPHIKLFETLRERHCFEEPELRFLESLFSRLRIRIGNQFLKVNKGVPQGSLLSPALFNIFIDGLVQTLLSTGKLSEDNILLFADDLLILCDSVPLLAEVIRSVETWAEAKGMTLNKKKSGIVPFANKKARKETTSCLKREFDPQTQTKRWKVAQKTIEGVPVLLQAKYLGTLLSFKLSSQPELGRVKRRTAQLFTKLFPFLAHASADARRDLWQTLVVPHFLPLAVLFSTETSKSRKLRTMRLWDSSFKTFLFLPKNTKEDWVEDLIGESFCDFFLRRLKSAHEKFCDRFGEAQKDLSQDLDLKEKHNFLIGIPNTLCQIIRDQTRPCPACSEKGRFIRLSEEHVKEKHNLRLIDASHVIEEIKEFFFKKKARVERDKKGGKGVLARLQRKHFIERWTSTLGEVLDLNREVLQKLVTTKHRQTEETRQEQNLENLKKPQDLEGLSEGGEGLEVKKNESEAQ